MRQLVIALTTMCMLFTSISTASAVESTQDIRQAVNVLKGLDFDRDSLWAIGVIKQAAEVDSIAYGMNALGMVYLYGLVLDKDEALATYWLEQAGKHGYLKAYHNLGMFYKRHEQQDFNRAFHFYKTGAEAGSVMCYYDLGYMYYKGLGCRQDYSKAAEWFWKGADRDHVPCLYMLGLCLRNGYGMEQDESRATFYLRRAALLGHTPAKEELARHKPENSWEKTHVNINPLLELPANMPDIEPYITSAADMEGQYQGALVVYDWSGQHVINVHQVAMTTSVKDSTLTGKWCEGEDTICIKGIVSQSGQVRFEEGFITKYDRYMAEQPMLHRFENADISAIGALITGRIRLYSIEEREPDRPMYLTLQKTIDAANSDSEESLNAYAYPNPFTEQTTVSFELPEKVASSKILLYSQTGANIMSYGLGELCAGKHSFTIHPALSDGLYVLHVVAGSHTYRTIIIKKRG